MSFIALSINCEGKDLIASRNELDMYIECNFKAWGLISDFIKSNELKKYDCKLGYSILINSIGLGLCSAHVRTIVINNNVHNGSNAGIFVDINIGNSISFGEKSCQ